ncbi:cupin domain-containing protein [Nitratifractor sp.]
MNLYDAQAPKQGERFDTLLEHKNIKIIRILSSDDLHHDLYDQEEDEWVVLLEGSARLEVDGKELTLRRGESLFLPAHTPHRILSTERGTLWLAVHIY